LQYKEAFVLEDHQKTGSSTVKQHYQAPLLVCYGALTELTQVGSGDMPENVDFCDDPSYNISGKSCE